MFAVQDIFSSFAIFGFIILDPYNVNAFAPHSFRFPTASYKAYDHGVSNVIMDAKRPSGSFFNQVPDKDDESQNEPQGPSDNKNTPALPEPLEESWAKVLESRQTSRASQPSTVGGIPTSQATGFGKPKIINTKTKASNKKSFIGIGKPMNDINNPEFDDQGYTLYADEETGEKKRVFEALVDYPSIFRMKIIGVNESTFAAEMVQIVAESCMVSVDDVKYTTRVNGKWLSVTVHAPVQSAEMLYSLYENIDKDPRVKFKF